MNQTQLQKLISILSELLEKYKGMLEDLGTPGDRIYNQAIACLGKDMAPIHNEFGCAEAVNSIVELAMGKPVGGGVSTYRMMEVLKNTPSRFKPISFSEIKLGDIIISPTGYGSGGLQNGHVGIMSDSLKIMSNNSRNGLWEENYTWKSWVARYRGVGGYPVYLFRVIS